MSAESYAAAASLVSPPVTRRVLRYAFGCTLAMAVAMGFQWPLSFLTPVLATSFLSAPGPPQTLKQGGVFVLIVAGACTVGLLVSRHLLSYPVVYLPFAALLLFLIFFVTLSGRWPLLTTWLLIAVLVLPMVSIQSAPLAAGIARGIVFGAAIMVVLVRLTHLIFPEPAAEGSSAAAPAKKPSALSRDARYVSALTSTAVVFPVFALFYMFQWSGALVVLIFVAILSAQPALATNFKAGVALIVGNVVGGAAAITMYELLVMFPEFVFLLMLTLLAGLFFGSRAFTGKPSAALYNMAFSTLLLIIGSSTSSEGEAGAKAWMRVIHIMLAVSYVVLAFRVARSWQPKQGG